jgi:hypothetical protein
MTTVPYEEFDSKYRSVKVGYEKPGMKRYNPSRRFVSGAWVREIEFYVLSKHYEEIELGTREKIPVAFIEAIHMANKSCGVDLRPITNPVALESIVNQIEENKTKSDARLAELEIKTL